VKSLLFACPAVALHVCLPSIQSKYLHRIHLKVQSCIIWAEFIAYEEVGYSSKDSSIKFQVSNKYSRCMHVLGYGVPVSANQVAFLLLVVEILTMNSEAEAEELINKIKRENSLEGHEQLSTIITESLKLYVIHHPKL
jgi:hypothetical protein